MAPLLRSAALNPLVFLLRYIAALQAILVRAALHLALSINTGRHSGWRLLTHALSIEQGI